MIGAIIGSFLGSGAVSLALVWASFRVPDDWGRSYGSLHDTVATKTTEERMRSAGQ